MNSTIKPTCKVGDIASAADSGSMAGCKLLRRSKMGENGTYQAAWGVYRTGPEFVQAAIAAIHPLRGAQAVDDAQASVLLETLSSGPVAVAKKRMLALRHWESRARELQPEEDKLRLNWSPEKIQVLEGKRFLLLDEMLKAAAHVDMNLIPEIIQGGVLTGVNAESKSFPRIEPWKTSTPVSELRAKAKWVQRALLAKCKAADDPAVDKAVWQATKEELEKKWISGPFDTIDEVTASLGTDSWIPSPRFGLQQGSKVRAIDNYTAGGINGAFCANE